MMKKRSLNLRAALVALGIALVSNASVVAAKSGTCFMMCYSAEGDFEYVTATYDGAPDSFTCTELADDINAETGLTCYAVGPLE